MFGGVHLDRGRGTLDWGRAVQSLPAQQAREGGKEEVPQGQEVEKQAKGASSRGMFIHSRFNLIKKLIKLLNCLKLKIVSVIFENYRGRNDFGIFWDKWIHWKASIFSFFFPTFHPKLYLFFSESYLYKGDWFVTVFRNQLTDHLRLMRFHLKKYKKNLNHSYGWEWQFNIRKKTP